MVALSRFGQFSNLQTSHSATDDVFDIGLLRGQTVDSIAGELSDPTSPRTQAIIGSANALTAAICSAAGNSPADVCSSAAISTLQSTLAATART